MVALLAGSFGSFPLSIPSPFLEKGRKMKLKITPDSKTSDQLAELATNLRMVVTAMSVVVVALAIALIGALHNAH